MAEAAWSRAAAAEPNDRARMSILVGVLSVIAIPAGLALAAYSNMVDLTLASISVPVAGVLGLLAMSLARGARKHSQVSLGRIGGTGLARAGWILGMLGLYLAVMAALSVGFFGLLLLFE